MAASEATTFQVIDILVEEVGYEKAHEIISRIWHEVNGNGSFKQTMYNMNKIMKEQGASRWRKN